MANRWANTANSGRLYFGGAPKSLQMVTAAMKLRRLLLGKKVMTNLNITLKSRDITSATKVHLVKALVFLAVIYGGESWTVKKTESWRIDAFELWRWRRLLRVPGTAKRSNQSILKEIIPEYSWEGLILKLKLQYFGHLMGRTDSLGKTLMLGKLKAGGEGNDRGWNVWMASLTRWTWVCVNSGRWWWTGRPGVLWFMGLQRVQHDWVTELNWTNTQNNKWPKGNRQNFENHVSILQNYMKTHLKTYLNLSTLYETYLSNLTLFSIAATKISQIWWLNTIF